MGILLFIRRLPFAGRTEEGLPTTDEHNERGLTKVTTNSSLQGLVGYEHRTILAVAGESTRGEPSGIGGSDYSWGMK